MTRGIGTFIPDADAHPTVGENGQIAETPEVRLEIICPGHLAPGVIKAVRAVHPYEEAAVDEVLLADSKAHPFMRVAQTPEPMSLVEFAALVDVKLNTKCWPRGDRPVQRVGIVGGGAGSDWSTAASAGCDTFLTGEGAHHFMIDADRAGINTVYAGHYATEHPGMEAMAERLCERGFSATCSVD